MARTPELHQDPYTREHGLPTTQVILRGISSTMRDVQLFECDSKPDGTECARDAVKRVLLRYEYQTQGIGFIVPRVWAAKCYDCGTVGFQNDVADQIDAKSYKIYDRKRAEELLDWRSSLPGGF